MAIIENIKIPYFPERLANRVHLDTLSPEYLEFKELLAQLENIEGPAALLECAEVKGISKDNEVLLTSVSEFKSALLIQLAGKCRHVFPFIATCGKGLEKLGESIGDPLHLYWLDKLKEYALETAFEVARNKVAKQCPGKVITSLVPLDDDVWALEGLKEVFGAFVAVGIKRIGVTLSDHLYMQPGKSRAGIFFPAEKEVDLCDLCSLKKCGKCPVNDKKCLSVNN